MKMAKKYSRKHGVLIAVGVLVKKPLKMFPKWLTFLEELKKKEGVAIEENCAECVFVYDPKRCLKEDILQLQTQELPNFIVSEEFKETLKEVIELQNMEPKIYVVHFWYD